MINTNELYIVNYCHPNCRPFQNIMRLPKEQAFKKAKGLDNSYDPYKAAYGSVPSHAAANPAIQ